MNLAVARFRNQDILSLPLNFITLCFTMMNPDNATKTNNGQVGETPRDDQLCQLNTPGYQGHQSAHHQWQNTMHQGGQGWQNQVTTPHPGANHAHGNRYL